MAARQLQTNGTSSIRLASRGRKHLPMSTAPIDRPYNNTATVELSRSSQKDGVDPLGKICSTRPVGLPLCMAAWPDTVYEKDLQRCISQLRREPGQD